MHDQKKLERKEKRDRLITQKRMPTTSVLSSTGIRSNPPQPPNPSSSKNQIQNVIKTATSRPPSANIPSKSKSNDSLSTAFSINQSQRSTNLSRSSTISSANRVNLTKEWILKKQEEEKSKPKKPAFKTGAYSQTSWKSLLPTSTTFNFSLSVSDPGVSKPFSSTAKNTLPLSIARPVSSKSKQSSKPSSRKNGNKLIEQANFDTQLDMLSNKMNSSICLNGPKVDTLNETHLGANPNNTSSPIKGKLSSEFFDKVELDKRDAKYYRDLVLFSTDKLAKLRAQWTTENEAPEEFHGDIRSACGLAKLLIDERFSQFIDLINQCEQTENVESGLVVKCSDLQGFWDMVDVQIKDVGGKFSFIEKLKSNGYVKTADMVETKPESVAPKLFRPNKNYLRKKDQKVREENQEGCKGEQVVAGEKKLKARTNNLAEFKAKMKAMKTQSAQVEIQIAEKSDGQVAEEVGEIIDSRQSVRKSLVVNDAVLTSSANFQTPVMAEKKSRIKSIYPVISEEDDKEIDEFFSLEDCPTGIWKTRPSVYPNGPTPARQTPKRVSALKRTFESASSPLLKLSFITAQSKRLSINRIFDKLE